MLWMEWTRHGTARLVLLSSTLKESSMFLTTAHRADIIVIRGCGRCASVTVSLVCPETAKPKLGNVALALATSRHFCPLAPSSTPLIHSWHESVSETSS